MPRFVNGSSSTAPPTRLDVPSEKTPLLIPPLPPQTGPKGRCWACWETTESRRNPLVRVCLGCKDADLQYIHQDCVDRFITSLPTPIATPSQDPWVYPVPDPTHPIPAQHQAIAIADAEEISVSPTSSPQPADTTLSGIYRCSRCCDPYTVRAVPVHPIRVLIQDKFLLVAMSLMTVCIIVLTVCCSILLAEHFGKNTAVIELPFLTVTMTQFAVCMLIFCHVIYAVTWKMVWDACKGQSKKHVFPVAGLPSYGSISANSA